MPVKEVPEKNRRILELREALGMKMSEFAKALSLDRQRIYNIENGISGPTVELFESILKLYPQVNSEWLLTGAGGMFSGEKPETQGTLKARVTQTIDPQTLAYFERLEQELNGYREREKHYLEENKRLLELLSKQ